MGNARFDLISKLGAVAPMPPKTMNPASMVSAHGKCDAGWFGEILYEKGDQGNLPWAASPSGREGVTLTIFKKYERNDG